MFNMETHGERPLAVGSYIFAGGFTLGMKERFNVMCHLEGDNYGVKTMRHNQPEIPIFYGPNEWPIEQLSKKKIDTVYGNPPCAAWSMAGRRGDSWETDPRVDCTRLHFSLLSTLKPRRAWIWESVARAFSAGRPFVDHLTEEAFEQGYNVTYLLHDGRWLGLPQRRKRFFFIAHRGPHPTPPKLNWAPPTTVRESLREVPRSRWHRTPVETAENKYLHLVERANEGAQLYKVHDELYPGKKGPGSGRPGYLARRLMNDELAFTFAGGAWFHPTEDRQLSMSEYKQLNGYPLDYEFMPRGDQAKMSEIARGVTPPVGRFLASWLLEAFEPGPRVRHPKSQVIDITVPP